MTTYKAGSRIQFEFDAGSESDIELTIPDVFSMTGKTARFIAKDENGNSFDIAGTVSGQSITFNLGSDTHTKFGNYQFEMWIIEGQKKWKLFHGTMTLNKTLWSL